MESGFELLSHPPYTSNLPSYDIILFLNAKKFFDEQKFKSKEEVTAATNVFFWRFVLSLHDTYFSDWLMKYENR